MEHKYYIVKCYSDDYDLNYKYLEEHLKKLNIKPDNNAMDIIKILDLEEFNKKNKKIDTYCDYSNIINLPKFNKHIFSADVFFLSIINNIVNKRFYDFPKYLLNIFNLNSIKNIINKNNIIQEINKINPIIVKNYVAKTFIINDKHYYEFPNWYILRPIDSFSGEGIKYINNSEDLNKAIEYYNKTKNYKNIKYGNNVIASEYISNPLLFKSKKFHLRLYYIISLINNTFNTFLWDIGKIMTAEKSFDMNIPFTKDKHDTHLKSTDNDYFYPKDFNKNLNKKINIKDNNLIFNKIKLICKAISQIIEKSKNKLLYPNEKNMYYLFGLDIMVKDNLEPVFIELNEQPGLNCLNNIKCDVFSKEYFQWINDIILEPLFRYKDPMIARKHHTYIDI